MTNHLKVVMFLDAKFLGGVHPESVSRILDVLMCHFPRRPPRSGKQKFHALLLILLATGCAASSVYRTDELRSHIRSNLFSTEHLAFGADPRSVNAVRSVTTEADIPILVTLLSDSSTAVVRIAQYVLVSYEEQSLPHLEHAANGSHSGIAQETIAMIRNRKTQ